VAFFIQVKDKACSCHQGFFRCPSLEFCGNIARFDSYFGSRHVLRPHATVQMADAVEIR